jgi:hypothetical protein
MNHKTQERIPCLALVGGRVVTVSGDTFEGGTVLLGEGKIQAVGESVTIPAGAERVDVSGKVVMPGLIDAHSHIGLLGEPSVAGNVNHNEMSSPITPLDQPWTGVLGGIAVDARYDAATQTIHTTVRNALGQKQCYVQVEPHLKWGTQTVGELGPGQVGDLQPGQQATASLSVASEPDLAGVAFDGYVIHVEVFDCGGPGPVPHTGGAGGEGGGEGHGPGGEGGSEGAGQGAAAGSEEGSGANLALDETFDAVRGGARLILNYDAAGNAFTGTVANTTGNVLPQVRIEVHLSNETELGPTTPVDLAPGQVLAVNLPATAAPFDGWIAHAEVGSGGEGGPAGGEAAGEHGSGRQGGEGSGGEHGAGGERRGGGEG